MIESEHNNGDGVAAGRKLLEAEPGIGGDHGRALVELIPQDSLLNATLWNGDRPSKPDFLNLHFDGGGVLRGVCRLVAQPSAKLRRVRLALPQGPVRCGGNFRNRRRFDLGDARARKKQERYQEGCRFEDRRHESTLNSARKLDAGSGQDGRILCIAPLKITSSFAKDAKETVENQVSI